jgi:hypothetical protein
LRFRFLRSMQRLSEDLAAQLTEIVADAAAMEA